MPGTVPRVDPIAEDRFEALVEAALEEVPDELFEQFENVAIVVEDAHPDEPDLLGLYEGVPLTDRMEYSGVLPDKISIYRLPLCEMCDHEDELIEEIAITVVHELAHHAGIDDDQLHEWGWA
jgi:predicted Zn-dependent protease with MMP-like domain